MQHDKGRNSYCVFLFGACVYVTTGCAQKYVPKSLKSAL